MKKKIIKRILSCLVVSTMCLQLAACSSGTDQKTSDDSSSKQEEEQKEEPKEELKGTFEGPTEVAKAPENIKVAFVPGNASMSGCYVPIEAMEEIAEKYTWETTQFDGEGTADGQNKAIMNAVTWGADAIVCVSVLASSVQQALKTAKEAGIPVVSGSNGTDDPNPKLDLEYDFVYDVGPDYAAMGGAMAQWIKEHTEASGKVVTYDCPGSYSIDYLRDGLYEELDKLEVDWEQDSEFTFEQLGDELNRMIISYLTKNPDTEFVFLPFDPASVKVVEGLEAAGFTDVKVLGVLGNTEMCALISQGGLAVATAAYDNVYLGYATIDQMIRTLNGQELAVPHGENLPYCIVDASNVPDEGEAWVPDFDYKSAFYALWD